MRIERWPESSLQIQPTVRVSQAPVAVVGSVLPLIVQSARLLRRLLWNRVARLAGSDSWRILARSSGWAPIRVALFVRLSSVSFAARVTPVRMFRASPFGVVGSRVSSE
ncbi:hypothetical protein AXF14_08075 [Actinomyces radicidentis]|uniref:Uncharacterized protein n=1 Tax=Actinomyces radicidentis TaxID=111015 RepID=A0A109W2R7_ACTRD|nr:hypothetical protein AXF14_08075 [Actinomyces radicidentis]